MGRDGDVLSFLEAARKSPGAADFFMLMRALECAYPDRPQLGRGRAPGQEPARLGQAPELAFTPTAIADVDYLEAQSQWKVDINFFGLIGPDGPLPLYLTEFIQERLDRQPPDTLLLDFINLLQHRFIAFFYRAWAQSQPSVYLDNPARDRFTQYVASLMGEGRGGEGRRQAVADYARYHMAGWLVKQVRSQDGLLAIMRGYLKLPVRIEQFVGEWLHLPDDERTQLGAPVDTARLGRGAVLGSRVWDRQHRARLVIGPMNWKAFERFLPGGDLLARVVAWLRTYSGYELAWEIRLTLEGASVPSMRLGSRIEAPAARLGWSTWLGRVSAPVVGDVAFEADRVLVG